jgi:DNA transformation protein and related proteins
MPVSPEAKARFVTALESSRPITFRAMFGGLGFYLDGVFMGIADDDRLYFKIDEQSEGAYIERGMEPWILGADVQPYREVPHELLEDPEALGPWIDGAKEAAIRRKAASAAKKKRKA